MGVSSPHLTINYLRILLDILRWALADRYDNGIGPTDQPSQKAGGTVEWNCVRWQIAGLADA